MPKPDLPSKALEDLEGELIEALLAGLRDWRPDLSYPESHSDMQGCVREAMERFHITRRRVPIDLLTGRPRRPAKES